jgi:calcineurin-like phosphoesterase family protein
VLLALLLCLALALAGLWLGVRLATPGTYETPLGRVSVGVSIASHGEVAAYVPLADWGVRTRPFSAPVDIRVEPRTLERDAALRAARGDRQLLGSAEEDLRDAVISAVLRSVRFGLGGAAAAALLLALVLLARRRAQPAEAGWSGRRAVLVGGPVLVLALAALACLAVFLRAAATFDERALERPTYFARGAELVQLVDAAENARQAGEGYADKVEGAVRSFATLLSDPTSGRLEAGRRAILCSDLHDNGFALASLEPYAEGKPVFFVGDFGASGSLAEAQLLVPGIARLGSRVVAVSGNHDSSRFMRALARRGVTVLERDGVLRRDGRHGAATVEVDGLVVAGFDDPLEWRGRRADDPRRVYSFAEMPDPRAREDRARRQLVAWFDGLPRRPDVVLLHQNGLALYLARLLQERGDDRPLTILTGHDHRQHVDRYGPHVVVDAGTLGAGGIAGVGQDSVGLADLHFSLRDPGLQAVDLLSVEPVSGNGLARRVVNRACDTPDGRCRLSAPRFYGSTGPEPPR